MSLAWLWVTGIMKCRQRGSRVSIEHRNPLNLGSRPSGSLGRQHVGLSLWWDFTHSYGVVDLIMLYTGEVVNWGRTCCFPCKCNMGMSNNWKGRKAKEWQVVGCPHSTNEAMNKINSGGKAKRCCSSQHWHTESYRKGNIICTQR